MWHDVLEAFTWKQEISRDNFCYFFICFFRHYDQRSLSLKNLRAEPETASNGNSRLAMDYSLNILNRKTWLKNTED